MSAEVIDFLTAVYEQHNDVLIEQLSQIGISFPAIVGIDWRLDYSVRSKHGGRENTPLFMVSLQVKDRGIIRYVDMIATQEELQDLLAKVKDAVKQVERVLSATN